MKLYRVSAVRSRDYRNICVHFTAKDAEDARRKMHLFYGIHPAEHVSVFELSPAEQDDFYDGPHCAWDIDDIIHELELRNDTPPGTIEWWVSMSPKEREPYATIANPAEVADTVIHTRNPEVRRLFN